MLLPMDWHRVTRATTQSVLLRFDSDQTRTRLRNIFRAFDWSIGFNFCHIIGQRWLFISLYNPLSVTILDLDMTMIIPLSSYEFIITLHDHFMIATYI